MRLKCLKKTQAFRSLDQNRDGALTPDELEAEIFVPSASYVEKSLGNSLHSASYGIPSMGFLHGDSFMGIPDSWHDMI